MQVIKKRTAHRLAAGATSVRSSGTEVPARESYGRPNRASTAGAPNFL
jgi:hypothetical protein